MSNNKTNAKRSDRPTAPIADKLDFVVAEAYNVLRTNLMLCFPGVEGGKVIGVTSAAPQDGKSYTSVNMAYALAKDGQKTLLVSADLRKPSIEKVVGTKRGKGLSNVLAGTITFSECVLPAVLHENLDVLTAGSIPPTPSELLGSRQMGALIDDLRKRYDYVILDLPPVLAVIDPVVASQFTDGMIVVVRHLNSRKQNIYRVLSQLQYANARVLGFVYNAYQTSGFGYYRKNKYYSKYRGYKNYNYRYYRYDSSSKE